MFINISLIFIYLEKIQYRHLWCWEVNSPEPPVALVNDSNALTAAQLNFPCSVSHQQMSKFYNLGFDELLLSLCITSLAPYFISDRECLLRLGGQVSGNEVIHFALGLDGKNIFGFQMALKNWSSSRILFPVFLMWLFAFLNCRYSHSYLFFFRQDICYSCW